MVSDLRAFKVKALFRSDKWLHESEVGLKIFLFKSLAKFFIFI